MPGGWNGSGVFTRYYGTNTWQNDAAAGTLILADRHDNNDQGLATGINACLTKNGENSFTGSAFRASSGGADLGTTSVPWDYIYLSTAVAFKGATYTTSLGPPATQLANTTVLLPDIDGTLPVMGTSIATSIALSGSSTVNLIASGMDPNLTQLVLYFDGVSLSGTDNILIQMMDTGGAITSGYLTRSSRVFNAAATSSASSSAGFIVLSEAANCVVYGTLTLDRVPSTSGAYDDWAISGVLMQSTGSSNVMVGGRGVLSVSTLDGLRVTTTTGDTFDAGTISVVGRYC